MKFLKIGSKIINTSKIIKISIDKSNFDSKFRVVVFFEQYDNSGSTKCEGVLFYKEGLSLEEAKKELNLLYKKLNKGE